MNSKKLNKALSVGLCASVLVPGIVSAKEFKDVKANGEYGWAYKYIDVLSDKGVIDGYPNGKYEPAQPVSLEETFQLLKGIIDPSSQELKEAVNKYGSICDENGVSSWAKDAIALALSRGIVSSTDLKQAKDKDLNKIPAVTKGYLASLVEAGIFDATGSEGLFEGNRHIRRSEMAKITKLSYDHAQAVGLNLEEKTIEGKVILATNLNNIDTIITEKDSKRSQFRVDSNTVYKMNDKTASFKDIKPEQEIKVTYVKNGDDTVTGLAKKIEIINTEKSLIGYVTDSNKDSFTVKYREFDEKEIDFSKDKTIKTTDNAKFKLEKDAKIYKYGKKINEDDLKVDDLIEFKTNSSGDVKEAYVYSKDGEVTGKVIEIDKGSSSRKASITLKLNDDKKYVFYAKNNNDDDNPFYKSNFFDGVKEDKEVTLQLNYKIVTKIGAKSSNEDFIVGEITRAEEYNRADGRNIGEIRVKSSNGTNTYYLTKDTEFKDDKTNAKNPQSKIEDLKGETVKLELKGDKVTLLTKIDARKAIDAVAQITKIGKYDRYSEQRDYTIKILDVGYGKLYKGDEFIFTATKDFDRYDVIRITGQKTGSDLDEIVISFIEHERDELNSYKNFNYNNSNKNNNDDGYNIKWK